METNNKRPDFTEGHSFWQWFFWNERKSSIVVSFIINLLAIFFITATTVSYLNEQFDYTWHYLVCLAIPILTLLVFWIGTYRHWSSNKRGESN